MYVWIFNKEIADQKQLRPNISFISPVIGYVVKHYVVAEIFPIFKRFNLALKIQISNLAVEFINL